MGSHREAAAVVRDAKGKVVDRGYKYPKIFVYIPKEVATDTAFPFKTGEDVTVVICGQELTIRKMPGKRKEPKAKALP